MNKCYLFPDMPTNKSDISVDIAFEEDKEKELEDLDQKEESEPEERREEEEEEVKDEPKGGCLL